jgi:acetyl-CoA acetyltransferase
VTDVPAAVIGTGLGAFGRFPDLSLKALAEPVVREALAEAALAPDRIDMAFVANAASAIITGQVAVVGQVVLSHVGFHGIPVYNVDNACAGSSSALNLAVMAIRSGAAERVLVLGVEKLYHADRALTYRALNGAADLEWAHDTGVNLDRESVFVKAVYPQRLARYQKAWGLHPEILAKIAVKNRAHAALNPLAQYREPIDVEQVLSARIVADPLTVLMCAPIGDGASAVVVAAAGAAQRSVGARPVWIRGSAVSMGSLDSAGATIRRVADQAYHQAGVNADEIDIAEVHDATAFTELLAYEELGFCQRGHADRAVEQDDFTLHGRLPVNPSGGLESRGHPVGATGVAQVVEVVRQLRGDCDERQVARARHGLAESAGGYAGGDSAAVAVHILGRDSR